jgi:glyoxylase-like metal-dependent hydrolase (beta-lactamase superfamily II)
MKSTQRPCPEVFLLKPGSIKRDEYGRILDARSSVTLVVSIERKIVVDTGLASEDKLILDALAHLGFKPEEIDTVINTHSHNDHCENNQLFPRARILAPADGELIVPGVQAMKTPGHSSDSTSIVVEGLKTIVIAGDALPTFNNFLENIPPSIHVDRELAASSMAKIISIADIIVPGHDSPFSVRERSFTKLPIYGIKAK